AEAAAPAAGQDPSEDPAEDDAAEVGPAHGPAVPGTTEVPVVELAAGDVVGVVGQPLGASGGLERLLRVAVPQSDRLIEVALRLGETGPRPAADAAPPGGDERARSLEVGPGGRELGVERGHEPGALLGVGADGGEDLVRPGVGVGRGSEGG